MEVFVKISEVVKMFFADPTFLMLIGFSIIFLTSAFHSVSAFVSIKRKSVDAFYYGGFAILIAVFTLCRLAELATHNRLFNFIANTAFYFATALLTFHIWRQTSHKEITRRVVTLYFGLPVVMTLLEIIELGGFVVGNPLSALLADLTSMQHHSFKAMLYAIYCTFMTLKSYLLCMNVFYQMPVHMQRTATSLIFGITLFGVVLVSGLVFSSWLAAAVMLGALYFTVDMLYAALFVMNSSNVIATSRKFVFEGLTSFVIVTSKKDRVLDWNIKDGTQNPALPTPYFKEPFAEYKKRILENNGRTSQYSENIISTTVDDKEYNFQIVIHDIRTLTREYGQLIEIQDVSVLVSLLHFFEDIAYVDHLTGLRNRNAYLEFLKTGLVEKNLPLGIVSGDVNYLKKLNDSGGHLLGDKLLKICCDVVAEVVEAQIADCHGAFEVFSARTGGDELVLLYPRGGETAALDFIDRVNVKLEAIHDDEIGTPSISWGYSEMASLDTTYNEMFEIADQRMYADKKRRKAGRDDVSSGFVPVKVFKPLPETPAEQTQSEQTVV